MLRTVNPSPDVPGAIKVSKSLRSGALSGVTATVIGVIVNLALWFSMHVLFALVTHQQFAGENIEGRHGHRCKCRHY